MNTNRPKTTHDAKRQAQMLRLRIWYGFKSLFTHPFKLLFVLPLCVAFLFFWLFRDTLLAFVTSGIPIFYGVITVVFLLLLVLLLYALGTPRKAKKIDRRLPEIFHHDSGHGRCPIYLSRQRIKTTHLWRYTFYSEDVPIEDWASKKERLVTMLGGYIDSISNGGKDEDDVNYIVVIAGKGAKPKNRPTPADPLFRE